MSVGNTSQETQQQLVALEQFATEKMKLLNIGLQ